MKIILSRKGFDSSIGGVPSPIYGPRQELYSLPIPEQPGRHTLCYRDIRVGDHALGAMVNDLTSSRITPLSSVHLDPDLRVESLLRHADWKPVFGQASAAEGHLRAQQVESGDLFLFYGWFRAADYVQGKYRYCAQAPDLHVIFGWLQIGEHFSVDNRACIPSWAAYHPHCAPQKYARLDRLYIAANQLHLPGVLLDQPGGVCSHRCGPRYN